LFGSKYANGSTNTPTTSTTDADISVYGKNDSSEAVNVVAPGTKSPASGFTFGITGTPEVDSKVSAEITAKDIYLAAGTYGVMEKVTVDETNFESMVGKGLYTYTAKSKTYKKVTNGANYNSKSVPYYALAYTAKVDEGGYYPVKYKWTSGEKTVEGKTKATEIAEAIAEKFSTTPSNTDKTTAGVSYSVSKNVESNLDLSENIGIGNEKLTWEWAFESEKTIDQTVTSDSDDARDTVLGDLMAAGTSNDKVVAVADDESVTVLTVVDGNIVKNAKNEVGCLETAFNIKLIVEQVD
jgi:hypothetical protein